jgi:hypothetical protein
MTFCALLCDGIHFDFALGIDVQILRLLQKCARVLLAQFPEGLADVSILDASQLSVAHVLNHYLIMLFTFLQFFDFLMRNIMLLEVNPQHLIFSSTDAVSVR